MSQPSAMQRADRRALDWLRFPPAWFNGLVISVALWVSAIVLTDTPVSVIVVAGAAPFVLLGAGTLFAIDRVESTALRTVLGIGCCALLIRAAFYLVPAMPSLYF